MADFLKGTAAIIFWVAVLVLLSLGLAFACGYLAHPIVDAARTGWEQAE